MLNLIESCLFNVHVYEVVFDIPCTDMGRLQYYTTTLNKVITWTFQNLNKNGNKKTEKRNA